jgi:predicted nucleic acid-binding protein
VTIPTSNPGAVVLDANVVIALVSNEPGRDAVVTAEITHYASQGYQLFAPGVIVAETLYILCGKLNSGSLSPTDYATAVAAFRRTMVTVLPPPNGDAALILRAEQIGSGYGCSRSADGISIALAEELAQLQSTVLLTFDKELPKQAARQAPTVTVQLL